MTRRQATMQVISEYSLPLILGIAVAMFLANWAPVAYESFLNTPLFHIGPFEATFKRLINEVFMAFFFGLATKELVEAMLPGGCLENPKRALNPILATIVGAVIPALLYVGLVFLFLENTALWKGLSIPIATDIAFAWLGARLLFGPGHPAIQFLLLLAILDDAIGMIVLALFYPNPTHGFVLPWVGLIVVAMAIAYALRKKGVQGWGWYIGSAGVVSWFGMVEAGLHPALSLAIIVPFIPWPKRDLGLYTESTEENEERSPLSCFATQISPFIEYGLFFFALANAGVAITANSFTALTAIIFVSLVGGKLIGISLAAIMGHAAGLSYPQGVRTRHLPILGLLAGIDITVSLFLADRIFGGTPYEDAAKLGPILTLLIPLVLLLFYVLRKTVLGERFASWSTLIRRRTQKPKSY